MKRRRFLAALVGALLGTARAQPAAKLRRIGYLWPTRRAAAEPVRAQLAEALRELGYVEGQTIRIEVIAAEDDFQRLPALAAELAQSRIDIIVAVSPPAIIAASRATRSIPIVMAFWGDEGLVESGLVASYARPGGNVTGVNMLAAELEGKRLEVLLQALPNASRIAVLDSGRGAILPEMRRVADAAKVELRLSASPLTQGYDAVFQALAREHVDAVQVPSYPRFALEQDQIVAAAARYRLPAIYEWGDMARAGGLIAYGPVFMELQRLVARYVDRIFKGAKPGDLSIEQPTKFELVVNLKTARALGLTLPQPLLLRADEVIE